MRKRRIKFFRFAKNKTSLQARNLGFFRDFRGKFKKISFGDFTVYYFCPKISGKIGDLEEIVTKGLKFFRVEKNFT